MSSCFGPRRIFTLPDYGIEVKGGKVEEIFFNMNIRKRRFYRNVTTGVVVKEVNHSVGPRWVRTKSNVGEGYRFLSVVIDVSGIGNSSSCNVPCDMD